MMKLYGIAASNYYSAVKAILIEKNIEFETIEQFPSQEPEVLACSPMGKLPYIETEHGFLSETNVIYDYIEDTTPEPALYPADAFARARTKEIVRIAELYLDAPARRHLGKSVFGEDLNQAAYDEVRPVIEKGLNAFTSRAQLSPYAMGDMFTYADIAFFFKFGLANFHTKDIYDWDITETHPEIGEYINRVAQRPSVASVQAEMVPALMAIVESSK